MDIKRVLASAPRKHDLGEERSMLTVWGEALDPAAVRAMLDEAAALEDAGLTAFVYTQLSDVEEEVNGILTYDRRVNKLKEAERGSCASDS